MIPKKIKREGPKEMDKAYCNGGEAMAEGGEVDDNDMEKIMDECGSECMRAIRGEDIPGFRDSFHALVMHSLSKAGLPDEGGEE